MIYRPNSFQSLPRFNILLILFLIPFIQFPQKLTFDKNISDGNKLLLEENYNEAIKVFQLAYSKDTANPYLNYKLGLCYLHHPKERYKAEYFLEKSIKYISDDTEENNPDSRTAPPMALFYYGIALHFDYRFEEAIKNFELYRARVPEKFKDEINLINYHIQTCKNALQRVENPSITRIRNLGDSINDIYAQQSVHIMSNNEAMLLTISSPEVYGGAAGTLSRKGLFFSDVFFSSRLNDTSWSKARGVNGLINSTLHEITPCVTADLKELIFSRGDDDKGDLYTSKWDGVSWLLPEKIDQRVNSKYAEKSPSLSKDGSLMFFSSNRLGGYGGYDLYRCKKLPNGNWAKPENLGPKVNTKQDEDYPFVHLESNELFFSSKGHATMGGFDIFNINLDSNVYAIGEAVPLAYPINSTSDDISYVMSFDDKMAYYSSNQQVSDSYGDFDLYQIYISESQDSSKPEKSMVVYKGHILTSQNRDLHSKLAIHVTYKSNNSLYGDYKPQLNGNFVAALKPGNTFIFSYLLSGKEYFMEELSIPDTIELTEIERKDTIVPIQKQEPVVVTSETKNSNKFAVVKLTVIDLKNFLPEPGAKIELMEDVPNGKKYEFFTNDKGFVDSIMLPSGKYFRVLASFREYKGEEEIISTKNEKEKNIAKTLYVYTSKETYNPDSLIHGKFIHYFEFNVTEVDHFHNYQQFLDSIDATINRFGEITIAVKACASHLPTNFKGGLQALSKKRAMDFERKLIDHLKDIKKDPKKIKFELSFAVEGPAFTKDYRKKLREYEKHQYVEAYIKPNKKKTK